MGRKQNLLDVEWTDRFRTTYAALSHDRQKGTDKVVLALIKQEPTPGMRIKPIEPEKYYNEARVNDGDRLVFRIEDDTVWFIDVVNHDQIGKYGKRIAGLQRRR